MTVLVIMVLGSMSLVACGPGARVDDSVNANLTDQQRSRIEGLTASVSGGGASFPDAFYQAVNVDFNKIAGSELVTYAKSGSADGRSQLAAGTYDFAGSDSLPEEWEVFPGEVLFFPTVAAPITVSFNLAGIESLNLSPEVIAKIFQGDLNRWDVDAIASDNPDVELPRLRITVVHRSDGSGTTNNFTSYLDHAVPDIWRLGSGDEVNWPNSTQGAEKNSGVAEVIRQTDGAIGYVDIADAAKADLDFARIRNSSGEFMSPSVAGVQAALEGVGVAEDMTFDPLNSPASGAYPITAPTWLLVLAQQDSAAQAETMRAYVDYLLTVGQDMTKVLGYVPLPETLRAAAHSRIARITS